MKVTFRRILYGETFIGKEPSETREIVLKGKPLFCCKDMDAVWGDAVAFGEDRGQSNWNREASVNIYCVSPYEVTLFYDSIPIKFCPFCAEAVEYKELPPLKMVKRVEEVPATIKTVYDYVPADVSVTERERSETC